MSPRPLVSGHILAALLLTTCATPVAMAAQSATGEEGTGPRVATGVELQTFSFGSPAAVGAKSATLLVTPFAARLLALPSFSLDLAGSYARGSVTDAAGNTATLAGLTDTEVRAGLALQGQANSFGLSAGALLPTGHATLAAGEMPVAGLVSSNLLPFRISNWGYGGGAILEMSAAHGGDAGSVGATIGYRFTERFQPLAADPARYRPGNEASLQLAATHTVGAGGTLSLQLAFSQYASDQWNSTSLLKPGQRILVLGGCALPVGYSGSVTFYGGVLHRSGGALSESLALSGLLGGVQAPPSETLVLTGGSMRLPSGAVVFVPTLDFRALRRADGTGQGWLGSLGTSVEVPLGDSGTRIVPSLRLHLGRLLVSKGLDSAVRGFDLGVGLDFGGAR